MSRDDCAPACACPCHTGSVEPGEHLPTCAWADPDYEPYVCPGCYAVAERCHPGCIDDEIEREREEACLRGDYDRFDKEDDDAAL